MIIVNWDEVLFFEVGSLVMVIGVEEIECCNVVMVSDLLCIVFGVEVM